MLPSTSVFKLGEAKSSWNPDAGLGDGMELDSLEYSVVIPVYGSATILPELHRRLNAVMQRLGSSYEVIFVDDCGPDFAWDVLQTLTEQDRHVVAIQLMRNAGQSNATLCGLAHARGKLVITMDDDLQHPPEEIPILLDALTAEVDVVMGTPLEKRHHWFRRFGSSVMHKANSWLLGKDPTLRFTSFRVLRRSVVNGLVQLKILSPALGPMINSVTHRIINVAVRHAPRAEGSSGYTIRRLLSLIMNNLIGYSMLPLRLLGVIGGIGILMSIVYAVVLLIRYFSGDITVPGWTSVVLLLILLFGFNFFAFAILGEYLLRILQRANATPQYLVRRTVARSDKISI